MASSAPVLCKDEQGAKLRSGLPHQPTGVQVPIDPSKPEGVRHAAAMWEHVGETLSSMLSTSICWLPTAGDMQGAHSVTSASFPT